MKRTHQLVSKSVLLFFVACLGLNAQNNINKENIEKAMVSAMEWQEAHPIFALAPTDWTNGRIFRHPPL